MPLPLYTNVLGMEASKARFDYIGYGALTAAFALVSTGASFRRVSVGLPLTATLLFTALVGIHTTRHGYDENATVREAITRTSQDYGGPAALWSAYTSIRLFVVALFFSGVVGLLALVATLATAAAGVYLLIRRLFW